MCNSQYISGFKRIEDSMDPKVSVVPAATVKPQEFVPEIEIWEAPFERWLRMADDLLRESARADSVTRESRV